MSQFKRLKVVTLPVLKLAPNKTRYIKILSPITVGKTIDDKKEPAHICEGLDLQSLDMGIVVCPIVLRNELQTNYPAEKYVGRSFEITVSRAPGKSYNHVTLIEVAEPDDLAEQIAAKEAGQAAMLAGDAAANAQAASETFDEGGSSIDAPVTSRRRGR